MYVPEIRFCNAADLPALLSLNALSACPWPESVVEGDFDEGAGVGITYLGAFTTGASQELLGYAVLGREKGDSLLMALIVRMEFRRRGIGSQLLAAAGDCASYLGFAHLRLRVRRSNAAAIALYEGMSFAKRSVSRGYYSNGEDAIVMSARLPLEVRS
ncbi:MAG: GNAT family N-acetyltransferase [Fretibacterium sp.]|nr:GNAT family N-acetyltransferase [Fretibacterium sp.]